MIKQYLNITFDSKVKSIFINVLEYTLLFILMNFLLSNFFYNLDLKNEYNKMAISNAYLIDTSKLFKQEDINRIYNEFTNNEIIISTILGEEGTKYITKELMIYLKDEGYFKISDVDILNETIILGENEDNKCLRKINIGYETIDCNESFIVGKEVMPSNNSSNLVVVVIKDKNLKVDEVKDRIESVLNRTIVIVENNVNNAIELSSIKYVASKYLYEIVFIGLLSIFTIIANNINTINLNKRINCIFIINGASLNEIRIGIFLENIIVILMSYILSLSILYSFKVPINLLQISYIIAFIFILSIIQNYIVLKFYKLDEISNMYKEDN